MLCLIENYRKLIFPSNNIFCSSYRGGSRTAATSKMELFVIIVNGWQALTSITKSSILDAAQLRSASELLTDSITKLFGGFGSFKTRFSAGDE